MKKLLISILILFLIVNKSYSTFSICAVDPITGEVGSAGASCIGNCLILSYVQPGWGVIHIQASWLQANYNYARSLMLMHLSPLQIRDSLIAHDAQNNPLTRQYGIVDLIEGGRTAAYTGVNCTNYKNHIISPTFTVQGNILLGQIVLDSLKSGFNRTQGNLAAKLMASLKAAKMVGADTRCTGSNKSSISAFLRVAKPGDTLGTFYCNLVVPNTTGSKDPIDSLQVLYNNWTLTNISSQEENIPDKIILYQNYPNPFNPVTTIKFSVPEAVNAKLKIYDMLGKNIITLYDGNLNAGVYNMPLNASGISSGMYFYVLETKNLSNNKIFKEYKKMIILK